MAMAKRNVGMLGLGVMGSAMAANLNRAGFRVIGYDPLEACRRRHARAGGIVARNAEEVSRSAHIIICSLPSAKALDSISKAVSGRKIVVETSTLPLADKERAREALAARGATLLDCPLSGTGAQARTGDLVVYGSGISSEYKKVLPVLRRVSRSQYYLGRFGNGSKMKFVANLLVAIHNVSAAEAVVLARRCGLDAAAAVRVLGDGAGSSRMLQVRGPLMARRAYLPATMSMKLWQKDMKIIAAFARASRSPTPLFSATKAIYNAAMAQGRGRQDTAAVCAVLERRAR
jgi:3-hydroxyisobutyrate dehydrogenase-like beta-hydroxyacid dehydrogenase